MNTEIFTTFTAKAAELGYELSLDQEGGIRYITTDGSRYLPEVMKRGGWGEEPVTWEIQTTGYGTLPSEDIDKVMQGLMKAQLMVSYLQAWGF